MEFHTTTRHVHCSKDFEVQDSLLLIDFTVDSKNAANKKVSFLGNPLEREHKCVESVVLTAVNMKITVF
jgi:hypothetical protein